MLDLRVEATPSIPAGLTTGCFVLRDEVTGVGECAGRVTHAALNKDNGLVDPETGTVSDPTTPRGSVEDNFASAVAGAVAESRRQWQDFGNGLAARYGREHAELMVCALTHDDPTQDCGDRGWVPVLIGVPGAGLAVSVVAVLWLRARHRRGAPFAGKPNRGARARNPVRSPAGESPSTRRGLASAASDAGLATILGPPP